MVVDLENTQKHKLEVWPTKYIYEKILKLVDLVNLMITMIIIMKIICNDDDNGQ